MIKTSRQLKDLIRNLSKEKKADAQILIPMNTGQLKSLLISIRPLEPRGDSNTTKLKVFILKSYRVFFFLLLVRRV